MTWSLTDPGFAERARNIRILGIDFDGVMTDNRVYVFEDGREAVVCSRLEGYGLRRATAAGVYCFIMSTEKNGVVSMRAKKLEIDCQQDVPDKVEAFERLLSARGLSLNQAAFIGNDVNDLGVLQRVGLPVIVADAHEALDELSAFRTTRRGGDGAVREVCDAIASVLESATGAFS
jgi:3-deoxy-D-manno-octulosonate 8-phosphate phosphatase (KDO 8-P phosphatase)